MKAQDLSKALFNEANNRTDGVLYDDDVKRIKIKKTSDGYYDLEYFSSKLRIVRIEHRTSDEILYFVERFLTQEEMNSQYKKIVGDEKKYIVVKSRLHSIADRMESAKEKVDFLHKCIDVLTYPAKYSKGSNIIKLPVSANIVEQLKVADSTNWNIVGDSLHLQLVVITNEGPMELRSYPIISEEELLRTLSSYSEKITI